jgi:hypothetical protein
MPEDDKKFFDVSKPHQVGPHPTSKPVIVGHHPGMPDPMIHESAEKSYDNFNVPVKTNGDSEHRGHNPLVAEPKGPAIEHLPPTAKAPNHHESPPGHGELHLPTTVVHHKPRIWVWVTVVIILLALVYAAIDAKYDFLPLHIFSHSKSNTTNNTARSTSQSSQKNTQVLPAGFTSYQPTGTPLTFAYPTAWGAPATAADPGFTQRGKDKKSDGTHAYIVTFATNKDVEVAITSAKYLPAARGTLYYDYLQWCVGTNDGKFYKQILHSSTNAGVDTPSTITCDQGPLSDATKLSNAIIVQANTKDPGGATLGDIYSANLSNANDLIVFRVKDAKMTHGDDVKKLLSTIAGAANTSQ